MPLTMGCMMDTSRLKKTNVKSTFLILFALRVVQNIRTTNEIGTRFRIPSMMKPFCVLLVVKTIAKTNEKQVFAKTASVMTVFKHAAWNPKHRNCC